MPPNPLTQLPTGDPRSTTEVLRDVVAETQNLVRYEIQLAKAEVAAAAATKAAAIAGFLVAAVFALYGVGFLAAALAVGLGNVMPAWLATLVVSLIFFVGAGVAVAIGIRGIKAPVSLERTTRSLKEDAAWARTQVKG